MSGKEAVVFVLDSSPSMMALYPSGDTTTTRLSCAKSALVDMLSDLMIQSKTNQAGVVVIKTRDTNHSMEILDDNDEEIPYTNVTELTDGGSSVNRPTIALLRAVHGVEPTITEDMVNTVGGDLVAGITVAADALYRRTHGKKFKQRRIVIFTDANHHVHVDPNEMLHIMEGLREMECTLTVIGLDFDESAEFDHPATTSLSQKTGAEAEPTDETDSQNGEEDNDGEDSIEPVKEEDGDNVDSSDSPATGTTILTERREIEQLLIRLARLTGGSVIAASTMQQVLNSTLGKRIPKSTRKKLELRITPDLIVNARFSLLLSKSNIPSLKKEAVLLDDQQKPMVNGIGEEMTSEVTTVTDHWDPDNPLIHVGLENITQGYRYGSDCVPLGIMDKFGLQNHSPCCIEIIGYTDVDRVPKCFRIGPPYVLSGADSQHACAAISALAQALQRLKRVALCTFVKTKNADKILGALFPVAEKEQRQRDDSVATGSGSHRLMFLQLPFANDVQKLVLPPIDDFSSSTKQHNVCHDLIDSLMLPDGELCSDQIANPAIRSFHKTVVRRAIDPKAPVVTSRNLDSSDPMSTPVSILERSRVHLDSFRKEFPLVKEEKEVDGGGRPKKKAKYWNSEA